MRRGAYALSAALCCAALGANSARADVTYTWETQSVTIAGLGIVPTPQLTLSFEVSGPVDINANSDFATPSDHVPPYPQVQYQFPAQLVSFSITDDPLYVSESSFRSTNGNLNWSMNLVVDPDTQTASLSLRFRDELDCCDLTGNASASGLGSFTFDSDPSHGFVCPCTYTGKLVASTTVSEPRSLWVLMAGLGTLGLVSRVGARQSKA